MTEDEIDEAAQQAADRVRDCAAYSAGPPEEALAFVRAVIGELRIDVDALLDDIARDR